MDDELLDNSLFTHNPTPLVLGPLPDPDDFTAAEIEAAANFSLLVLQRRVPEEVESLLEAARKGWKYSPSVGGLFVEALSRQKFKPPLREPGEVYCRIWQCAAVNNFFRPEPDPGPQIGDRRQQASIVKGPDGKPQAITQILVYNGAEWRPDRDEPSAVSPYVRASDLDKQRPGRKPNKPSEKQDA